MFSKLSRFLTIATLTTLTCVITHPVNAQSTEMEVVETYNNIPELFNESFWDYSGDFWESSRPAGQLNTIFGWNSGPLGAFPENDLARDGLLIYAIVADYWKQLQENDPILRTRDLDNPFDTSLRDVMSDSTMSPEPVFEPQYPMTEPIPESEPVRGLW